MTAAEKIKELRQSFAISQAQLAKRLGVTRSSVNAWGMGISTPTTQYIVDMAHIFHVSTDCLLGVEEGAALSLRGLTEEESRLLYGMLDYMQKGKRETERLL